MLPVLESPANIPMLAAVTDMPPADVRNWRLINLINHRLEKQTRQMMSSTAAVPTCLEEETGAAIGKQLGPPPHGGTWAPLVLGLGLDTKSQPSGGYLVGQKIGDMVDYLRPQSVCIRLGATLLDGLSGGIGIPVQNSGSSSSWIAQNPGVDIGQSDSSFSQLVPTPHILQSTTAYSRQLLSQSSIAIEAFTRADLMRSVASALDSAAISGNGTSSAPVGLMNVAGVGSYAMGTNGLAPSAAALCALEQSIADNNVDGPIAWASTPAMRAKLRQTAMFAGATTPCWVTDEGQDYLLGETAMVSRDVPQNLTKGTSTDCHAILVGQWSNMVLVQWGAVEILVDGFSLKKKNLVEITAYFHGDVVIRRPQAFAICLDARNV